MSYYHSTSGRENREGRRHPLPPIRDVLGDVLERPARTGPHANDPHDAYDFQEAVRALPHVSSRPHTHDPPQHYRPPTTHGSDPRGYSGDRRQPSQSQSPYGRGEAINQPYSYMVQGFSSTGELVDGKVSSRDEFPRKAVRSDPTDYSKRHICDECGERFDRPSALETHLRTHTGARPFECRYTGCQKAFSVKSNMLRHERTHEAVSAFELVDADDREIPSYSGRRSSNAQPSSSSHKSSAQYYSSSRRK